MIRGRIGLRWCGWRSPDVRRWFGHVPDTANGTVGLGHAVIDASPPVATPPPPPPSPLPQLPPPPPPSRHQAGPTLTTRDSTNEGGEQSHGDAHTSGRTFREIPVHAVHASDAVHLPSTCPPHHRISGHPPNDITPLQLGRNHRAEQPILAHSAMADHEGPRTSRWDGEGRGRGGRRGRGRKRTGRRRRRGPRMKMRMAARGIGHRSDGILIGDNSG